MDFHHICYIVYQEWAWILYYGTETTCRKIGYGCYNVHITYQVCVCIMYYLSSLDMDDISTIYLAMGKHVILHIKFVYVLYSIYHA